MLQREKKQTGKKNRGQTEHEMITRGNILTTISIKSEQLVQLHFPFFCNDASERRDILKGLRETGL